VLQLEVLIGELLAVNRLAAGSLGQSAFGSMILDIPKMLTLPRVKSPPWSMNSGMMRWNLEPL
jgi:hypothetical protein